MTQRMAKEGLRPRRGHEWNPLLTWPREVKCFCGSYKLHKDCHLGKIKVAIPKEMAKFINSYGLDCAAGRDAFRDAYSKGLQKKILLRPE